MMMNDDNDNYMLFWSYFSIAYAVHYIAILQNCLIIEIIQPTLAQRLLFAELCRSP